MEEINEINQIINQLIPKEQQDEIEILKSEINIGFKNLQMFRSEFLMRNSVLAMNPTIDGKYWQAILERNVHFWELIRLGYDFEEKKADINIKNALFERNENKILLSKDIYSNKVIDAENEKLKIQINREKTHLVHMRKEAEQRIREIKTWTKLINELKSCIKYSPNDPEECQQEEWTNVYINRLKAIEQIGTSDMNGAINTLIVGNTILNKKILK